MANKMCQSPCLIIVLFLLLSCLLTSDACRVGSEILKLYTRKSVENILDSDKLESIYWRDEPLNTDPLSKVTGLDIKLAETRFNLGFFDENENSSKNSSINVDSNEINRQTNKLIQDIFVTCSADRDRSYTLTINLELDNPFKVIDLRFNSPQQKQQLYNNSSSSSSKQRVEETETNGSFRIYLPDSSFLVQLNQRISYDECLDVKYVQLGPNINYQVECLNCSEDQKKLLDKIFSKKMTQFDAEIDSILSEKLLLGLHILLNQHRLDLDLFIV